MSKSTKEILGIIKLQVPSGKANPAPPIGPALGQKGLNIMEFCKQFNALKFEGYEVGTPIPVTITAYKDKSFTFTTKHPPVSYLIMKEIKVAKGSSAPGKDSAGKITTAQIKNVANKKMADMNASTIEACMEMVKGSAISMGLEVVE
ncbi:MAG: 50S ribosomal protein L11 [Alphaproteobacteria bacterium RIFCSPLOWO2_01_FULL_40_26]|nr:MAG: 50S ribosomal protein L11 [Alphaproteobacteria bacterium RIFCSPHIGHO2_02_FULL_40_34]OFW88761.1 MAG: 50S ribosomal protein L11 [Alphaproteobacteria bacterium RIFCSPHIGHO2_01_FULL_40_8]OFW94564.1 MAG: 50S ribosomal protein L11 [Alphaproteobacteria bacterium RIFCSPLOWO2_01_FULL_40_26]OFX10314.1 MAG: 50S ribosomal protein L11 [Alphaproteobacteria bacterium RIFCSPLOWO2_02_FULL_40_19]OFX11914.1 MAG: 50S ribosomal protein L11 [Alphaproteobacteria bacterium RIFCSPLOWO2_12_FULL_40_11]